MLCTTGEPLWNQKPKCLKSISLMTLLMHKLPVVVQSWSIISYYAYVYACIIVVMDMMPYQTTESKHSKL